MGSIKIEIDKKYFNGKSSEQIISEVGERDRQLLHTDTKSLDLKTRVTDIYTMLKAIDSCKRIDSFLARVYNLIVLASVLILRKKTS